MGVNTPIPLSLIPRVILMIWGMNKDLMIAITGDDGMGKSTLAYWIAKLTQPDFNLRTQIAYFADMANHLFLYAPRKCVVVCDENPYYKRDSGKKENKWGQKIGSRMRFQNRLYILCDRRIGRFDVDTRKERIKIIFDVVTTGKAEIFVAERLRTGDPWHLEDEEDDSEFISRCGVGYVEFPEMPPDERAIYDDLKNGGWKELQARYEEDMNGKSENDKGRIKLNAEQLSNLYREFRSRDNRITQKEFAEMFKINYNTLTNALKSS